MLDHHTETIARRDTLQPSAPHAVRLAAWVMYAGAVASAIRVVVAFVTAGATKTAIAHKYPTLSASSLADVTHVAVIGGAAVALIAGVLFVWIARVCMEGRNWARITGTVLCAIGVLFAVLDLTLGTRSSGDLIMNYVVAGIGLVSICPLRQRSSSAYFRQFTRTARPSCPSAALRASCPPQGRGSG
jgi:hypothetical protein